MAETKILDRSQIAEEYKWDLTPMYASDEAWEAELKNVDDLIERLPAYAGKLTASPESLRAFLDDQEVLERKLSNLSCYASLRRSEDTRAQAAQVMMSKARSKLVKVGSLLSFAEPEILSMSEEQFKSFIEAPVLKEYRFMLEDLWRRKAHTLTEAEEKILAAMGEVAGAPREISSMLQDADMVFDPVQMQSGQTVEVTGSNYILLQSSSDRELRKKAFESYYKGFKQHINTFTATYASSVKADVFKAQTRHYESARAMSMAGENVPASVYDSLVETVHRYLPAMYRYVALRKKILGLDELHYYDVYAPLMGDVDISYTFEQAKEMVKKAVAPLGEEYGRIVQKGFDEHWIDVMPNTGKSGGAFSSGTYDSAPYVLTNFTGTIDSVSTIAHEMGHSLHTYLSNHTQPSQYAHYTLFVAEVASTVNENLMIEQLLSQDIKPEMRLYLLNQYLENFKGTVYRQTMFAEFEKIAHEQVEKGEALSAEYLSELYKDLVQQYFGPELVMDEGVKYEWARIPHFYRSFYVYKYATGYSSAVALSEGILKEGQAAVKPYLEFLSMGGSQYPLDSLKHAGVDLTTPAPIEKALQKFEQIVIEAEKVYEQLK
ncbi:MAG: oligoendopeptidase F [Lachnospiraceae bacterium]|jgi:oligoendopeptidase F|nr:oligoendopeptidase F [Lachnospiraceae bacterium]